jgi:uncharacterized protein YdaU (DUF1376 family)
MRRWWMPLDVGSYTADTGHLSTVQHGAYFLLIMHYWAMGKLPDDDQQLANITRLPLNEWLQHRTVLQAFFYEGWKHRRLDAEIVRNEELRGKRARAGSKGGTVTSINRFRNRK